MQKKTSILTYMDARRRRFRHDIRTMSKAQFEYICRMAGMNDYDTELLTLFFFDAKDEDYIADTHGMCKSKYQKRKRLLVDRLISYKDFINTF